MEKTQTESAYRPWITIWSAPRDTAARAANELSLRQLVIILLINALAGSSTVAASLLKAQTDTVLGEFLAVLGGMLYATVILLWAIPLMFSISSGLFKVSASFKAIRNGSIVSVIPFILFNFITLIIGVFLTASGVEISGQANNNVALALAMDLAPLPTILVCIVLIVWMLSISGRGLAGVFGYTATKGVIHLVVATVLMGVAVGAITFIYLFITNIL